MRGPGPIRHHVRAMQTERPELPQQTLPHYSPDGRWWWDGATWLSIRPRFLVHVGRGAMPPSVTAIAHWITLLLGADLAVGSLGMGLWFPIEADVPNGRYLPFLLCAVAALGLILAALLLLTVRRRPARVGAVVLPIVALGVLTAGGRFVPVVHDFMLPLAGGLAIGGLVLGLYLLAAADAKAWFRVPPGRWW